MSPSPSFGLFLGMRLRTPGIRWSLSVIRFGDSRCSFGVCPRLWSWGHGPDASLTTTTHLPDYNGADVPPTAKRVRRPVGQGYPWDVTASSLQQRTMAIAI